MRKPRSDFEDEIGAFRSYERSAIAGMFYNPGIKRFLADVLYTGPGQLACRGRKSVGALEHDSLLRKLVGGMGV